MRLVKHADVQAQFEATGVVRLDGAFSPDQASAIDDAVWGYADRKGGFRRDDPATWPSSGNVTGMGFSWRGLKRNPVFNAVTENDDVEQAINAIFGEDGWRTPRPGAQILLTLPQAGPWILPDTWHMDCGFERPSWPVYAVKIFAFFGEVAPEGGGT